MFDESFNAPSQPYTITCGACQHANTSDLRFCESCGLPLKDDVFDLLHAPALREGRKWMKIVAILYLVGGFFMAAITWSSNSETAVALIIVNVALSLTQGGLWWWARRSIFPASIVSLTLYLTVILIDAIVDPMSLASGWLIKIFFISALAKAIRAGLSVRKMQAEMASPQAE